MIRLNFLQYNPIELDIKNNDLTLDSLVSNLEFDNLCKNFLTNFGFKKLKTFSFSKEGFLAMLLSLKDKKIAISKGETTALIEASKLYLDLGFKLTYLNLQKDGNVNLEELKNDEFDYIFVSSYVMDTFLIKNLENIKTISNAKIISNASANFS